MNNNELGTLLTLFIVCCVSVFYRSEVFTIQRVQADVVD